MLKKGPWALFCYLRKLNLMKTIQQLQALIAPAVEALDFELYGCQMHAYPGGSTLRVFVEGPNGVTLDDCAKISRQIGSVLDVEDPISGRYNLEVSSPGVDRPLFTVQHYEKAIGHKVKLRLRRALDDRRNYLGVITTVADGKATLQLEDDKLLSVSLDDVEKAKLIADF